MEGNLRYTLSKALRLGPIEGDIIGHNIQLRAKLTILSASLDFLQLSTDQVRKYRSLTERISKAASRSRNIIAHAMFGPATDGTGVEFFTQKANKGSIHLVIEKWTWKQFDDKINSVMGYVTDLQELSAYLTPVPKADTVRVLGQLLGATDE